MSNAPERRVTDDFAELRKHVDMRLTTQDTVLGAIDRKIDDHVAFTKAELLKGTPVIEAMEKMQKGITVIGWIGTAAVKVTAFFAACAAIWVAWKGINK